MPPPVMGSVKPAASPMRTAPGATPATARQASGNRPRGDEMGTAPRRCSTSAGWREINAGNDPAAAGTGPEGSLSPSPRCSRQPS